LDSREHYQEISTLIASIAKALGLGEEETAKALENEEITLELGEDDNGNRFVRAIHGDKVAQVYQGAIRYADGVTPPEE